MGILHSCKGHGRRVCVFCFVQTMAFPIEHVVWERCPVLAPFARWALGL